jgi:hypothetical protein
MAKTYFLKNHIDKIDTLNDQLWYYLFTTEELNRQLSQFSDTAKENFTTDLFKTNPYSHRIHVTVSSIPRHQRENKNATFGAYFSTCYEIISQYIKTSFDTLRAFNSLTSYIWDGRKSPEKNLNTLLTREGLATINLNIVNTITYLRQRRNHYTHIIEVPNPPLAGFLTATCPSLNAFWRANGTIVHLDFTKTLVRDFTLDETIELIKLLRICLTEMDNHIAGLLNTNGIIEFLVKRTYGSQSSRLNSFTLQQRINRIKNMTRNEFGLTIADGQIQPFASSIGIKRT